MAELAIFQIVWMSQRGVEDWSFFGTINPGPRHRLGSFTWDSAQQQKRVGFGHRTDFVEGTISGQACDVHSPQDWVLAGPRRHADGHVGAISIMAGIMSA